MNEVFSIGELARRAGVPVSTVRYYERRGILRSERRSAGNYRLYGSHELARLKFIRSAQRSGFRLEDIRQLLDLREGRADPCGKVQAILQQRLDAVTEDLRELDRVQGVLRKALAWCHESTGEGHCAVLDDLSSRASG